MTAGVTTLAAAFLSTTLFLAGAGAVSAPILIHLLARRRFKRIRWAAMEFLLHAQRRNRRRIRMEEWILLALRCLAVLLIAAMIGRPFLQSGRAAALLGGSRRTERVFVLDDSLSMSYQTPDGTPFAEGKQAIRRIIESVRQESPDDTVTLIRMSTPQSPVESGTFLDNRQTEALLGRLDALNPTQMSIEPALSVDAVVKSLEQSPDVTSAAVYFISDFQRNHWLGGNAGVASNPHSTAAGAGDMGLLDPLKDWAKNDRGLRLVMVNVGAKDASNLAVTDLTFTGGRLVAGATGTARATLSNFGERSQESIELQARVGNLEQPSKTVPSLGAWQQSSVDVDVEFLRPGYESVQIELPPDALPEDNVRYAAVDVAGAIRVLIVNGEPSEDDFDNETTYLETALHPEGEVFSGNETVVVDETELDDVNLSTFHVVVLANVYRLSEPAVDALEQFVRRGGGLLVFLGDQVDADLYNGALYRGGEGLLPAELTEIKRVAEASHLVVTDRLHPAMRGLSREGDPLGIGQINFFEYFGCRVPDVEAEKNVDDPTATPPNAAAGQRPPNVVARFDDPDRSPAIVERPFGRGRVTLVTTSADKEWHQWPDHPTFLPVMMELIRHVASRDETGEELWVGHTVDLSLDPAVYEPDAVVRTPLYPDDQEVPLTAVPSKDGRGLVLRWEHADRAGLYRFLLRKRDGGETVRFAAVNIDPSESDLTAADEADLRRAFGDVPFEYVHGLDQLGEQVSEARTEFWRLILVSAVLVLMVEQFLAFTWGRRR